MLNHPPPATPRRSLSPWQAFARRVLHDYPPAARAAWLAITLGGALALGWALWRLWWLPPDNALTLALALGLVAVAASLSIQLPRSSYSLSIGDVFVFGVLVTLGPAAAVLASGVDALAGTWRISRRLSSRLATPAASMVSMTVCAALFEAARAALLARGLAPEPATMAALAAVALVPFVLGLPMLMGMTALKRSEPLVPWRWLADSSWMAAIYVASALVAGLVHLQAQRFGGTPLLVSALSAIVIMLLLRLAVDRQEAERRRQEALVARAQHEAAISQQRFAAAFSHAAIGMAVVGVDGRVLQANDALHGLLGAAAGSLPGQDFLATFEAADARQVARYAQAAQAGTPGPADARPIEVRMRRHDGQAIWVELHCSRYDDPQGGGPGLIHQLHDVSARREAERRLEHIAYHDELTGLANRHQFQQRLRQAVQGQRQDPARRFAVLYLDLDRFKLVNDSLGHGAGNTLLREVAARLQACLRPGDLVARLGGDEFAVLLEAQEPPACASLAERVRQELARPTPMHGTELVPGVSIGITSSDLGPRSAEEVMRDADLAMYEAKARGRGCIVHFDRSMHDRVAAKLELENDLRRAIAERQLQLHFQPIFRLESGRVSGFEALARWTHPRRGAIGPDVFIALAEETGQIEALTEWVIDEAVSRLAAWSREQPAWAGLGVHVNICSRDLARDGLAPHVEQVLRRHGVAPGRLTLELTESMLMASPERAVHTMTGLRARGVRLSIDDFGTGYSSLSYLARLPIDSLKIDRSFVAGLLEGQRNLEIVRAMLTLGRTLGHSVVAEGVETEAQRALLREMGVHEGQGYGLARPIRADEVAAWLARQPA